MTDDEAKRLAPGTLVRVTSVNEPHFDGVVAAPPYRDGFGRWMVVVTNPAHVRADDDFPSRARTGNAIYALDDVRRR